MGEEEEEEGEEDREYAKKKKKRPHLGDKPNEDSLWKEKEPKKMNENPESNKKQSAKGTEAKERRAAGC